jgi:hypothetical protein
MRPLSKTDGHDGQWLIDKFVAGTAAVVEEIVVGEEHAVGEPVVADELPDVLDRVKFGAPRG